MTTNPRDRHAFIPSRPGGVVCVSPRRRPAGLADTEPCGYPAIHPIHRETVPNARPTAALQQAQTLAAQSSQSLPEVLDALDRIEAAYSRSDRAAALLTDVAGLRDWVRGDEHLGEAGAYAALDRIEAALRAAEGGTPVSGPRPDRWRCICDPTDVFEPPDPTPRAVEGCPAHRARRTYQRWALDRIEAALRAGGAA